MQLYSLFVDCEGAGRFSTQIEADVPAAAVQKFLEGSSLSAYLAKFNDWPKSFSSTDIHLFIPMDGLVNMYLCQFGRDGKYVTITLALTVSTPEPADLVNHSFAGKDGKKS